jgi:hypothetical protein
MNVVHGMVLRDRKNFALLLPERDKTLPSVKQRNDVFFLRSTTRVRGPTEGIKRFVVNVDRVRQYLCIVATNGPPVHPPEDI